MRCYGTGSRPGLVGSASSPEVQRSEAPWGRRVRRDASRRFHPTTPLIRLLVVRGPRTITRLALRGMALETVESKKHVSGFRAHWANATPRA
jgi:hypothetical protein